MNGYDWSADPPGHRFNDTHATKLGYTGHEHLDTVRLIHMNGRVQDPTLGRFLSPDPFVQSPANSQNYDRFGYTWNNPLSYTDPTGFFFKKIGRSVEKLGKAVVKVAIQSLRSAMRNDIMLFVADTTGNSWLRLAAQVFTNFALDKAERKLVGSFNSTGSGGGKGTENSVRADSSGPSLTNPHDPIATWDKGPMANERWRDHITVRREGNLVSISVSLRVTYELGLGTPVDSILREITEYWNIPSLEHEGTVYSMEVSFSSVAWTIGNPRSDSLHIAPCHPRDCPRELVREQVGAGWKIVFARAELGGTTMFARGPGREGTFAHEFGHNLGLGHPLDPSRGGIMGGAPGRRVIAEELRAIAELYGGSP